MQFRDFIAPTSIVGDLVSTSKGEALAEMVDVLIASGALSSDLSDGCDIDVAGRSSRVSRLDAIRCHYGLDGLVRGSGSRTHATLPDGPGNAEHYREALAGQLPEDRTVNGSQRGLLSGNFCERCLLECPAHTWKRDEQERE